MLDWFVYQNSGLNMDEERRKFFFMIMFEDKEEIAIGSERLTHRSSYLMESLQSTKMK